MMRFFYKTRNIIGLVLSCSLFSACISAFLTSSYCMLFLTGMFLSLLPLFTAMKHIPFRIWTLFCSLSAGTGIILFTLPNSPVPPEVPTILLGCSSSGILLLLPPWIAVSRYKNPALFLGIVWSGIILLAFPFYLLLSTAPDRLIYLYAALLSLSMLVILQTPPSSRMFQYPTLNIRTRAAVGASFFVFVLTLSAAGGFSLWNPPAENTLPLQFSAVSVFFWLTAAAAPAAAGLLTERKGIYRSCMFSVFLCESAILLFCTPQQSTAMVTGRILLLLAAGSLPVILPVLAVYLSGFSGYMYSFRWLCLWIPPGLLGGSAFWIQAANGTIPRQETAAFLILLLLLGFFCIFFAWKRRFIILKNDML